MVRNYYKRLDPPDAVILKLDLRAWKPVAIDGVTYEREEANGETGAVSR